MHNGNCKCGHHGAVKVVAYLAWLAGVLFFWTSWRSSMVWGFDYGYYAWAVVVLVLLAKVSMFCGCCGWGKMGGKMMDGTEGKMLCSHNEGCKCGDCGKCC